MPRSKRWALLVAAACAGVACGDRELTSPINSAFSPTRGAPSSTAVAPNDEVVQVLARSTSLSRDLTTSGIIGPRGGHLQIGQAGIRVDFAPGAVRHPTRITMTAPKGDDVAYEFQPHGLKFSAPVIVRQDLKKTAAATDETLALWLQGSYVEGDLADFLADVKRGLGRIGEIRKAKLHRTARILEFSIEHFSGYVLSTGRTKVEVEVEVDVNTGDR